MAAIDTVTMQSDFISEELAQHIESVSTRRIAVNNNTGEMLHNITTARLKGSYDARISIRIDRAKRGFIGKQPFKTDSQPYITLECSVHKAMKGHNINGGPTDFQASVQWLIGYVNNLLGATLPPANNWYVKRVDVAEVFDLHSIKACKEWFQIVGLSMNGKNVTKYGEHGIQICSTMTTVKFYHKGTEFNEHDAKWLRKRIGVHQVTQLQEEANRLLRTEVSIKVRKLEYDFGHRPTVSEITNEYLEHVYENEVQKALKEKNCDVPLVRTAESVRHRLLSSFGEKKGNSLFQTWLKLVALGESFAKENYKPSRYYEHMRLLKNAGCSLNGSDIQGRKAFQLVPQDFTPLRRDKRRVY